MFLYTNKNSMSCLYDTDMLLNANSKTLKNELAQAKAFFPHKKCLCKDNQIFNNS